jgi:hypothetical protein
VLVAARPRLMERRKTMARLEPVLPRLGVDDDPESVGSILSGLFAEADRRVAEAEARCASIRLVPALEDAEVSS